MAKILIAGTGKTALDIGSRFLAGGHAVTWATGSPDQKKKLEKRLPGLLRRGALLGEESGQQGTGSCCLLTDHTLLAADVIIESTSEILAKKRQLFTALNHLTTPATLFFSNSSSFLPETIFAGCLGGHFLFPLPLTNLVELIIPPGCSPAKAEQGRHFLRENGFDIIEQQSRNGFLVNRLLLPLQAECFKALLEGIPARTVDETSRCGMFPIGQLSLMDRIGLDIVYSAVARYTSSQDSGSKPELLLMLQALGELDLLGKKGTKNRDGLLMGSPLPWSSKPRKTLSYKGLTDLFTGKLRTRCREALNNGEISATELALIFDRVYQADNFDPDSFVW